MGVALEARCRLCLYSAELGEVSHPGLHFESIFEVMAALDRWAQEEGEDDVRVFSSTNFQGLSPEQVAERILAGRTIETGFDAIAWLFPNAGAGAAIERPTPPPPGMRPTTPRILAPSAPVIRHTRSADPDAPAPPPPPDPLAAARALVSVMMADGHIHPAEQKAVQRYLLQNELPELPQTDWRVYRPQEAGNPKDAASILAAMRKVAMSDGVVDGSELRVLKEYARAWQVPFDAHSLPKGGTFEEIRRTLHAWLR